MYMNVYIFFLTRRRVINLYSLQFPQNVSPVPVPSDISNSANIDIDEISNISLLTPSDQSFIRVEGKFRDL